MIAMMCILDCIFQVCYRLGTGLVSIRESCEVLLLTPRPVWVRGPAPAPCHGAEILRRLILPLTSVS